ncbi:MAG: HlyD family efflux transporter periplasmic adaptor subunit [Pseudomonadota bacterium]
MIRQLSPVLVLCLTGLVACGGDERAGRLLGELASDRIELITESNEPIVEILVAEGTTVNAGQLLLRQDSSRARARLAETEAAVSQAAARLDELVRGPRQELIAQARANRDGALQDVEFRELEMERASRLLKAELASVESRDRAKSLLDSARASLELRLAQLEELLAGTTVEELSQAEQSVAQAKARRDAVKIDVERHEIRAPVAGVFDSRLFETGERPPVGQPVGILLAGEQPFARAFIPEEHRVHVTPGTRARVYIDGQDEPLDGRVRWVASEAAFTPYFALTEHDRGRLTFLAKIDIDITGVRLPDGVPVEIELRSAIAE